MDSIWDEKMLNAWFFIGSSESIYNATLFGDNRERLLSFYIASAFGQRGMDELKRVNLYTEEISFIDKINQMTMKFFQICNLLMLSNHLWNPNTPPCHLSNICKQKWLLCPYPTTWYYQLTFLNKAIIYEKFSFQSLFDIRFH